MRNIANIDITKNPFELGYINEGSTTNEIVLSITSELTNTYIEITGQNGFVITEEYENEYILPKEYIYNKGTIEIRIISENYVSEVITFNIIDELNSNDDIILKIENGNYIIKKILINKYHDLPINSIINAIYPIGSIYMSINNIEPNILFGGTWERIKDTFLLSAGENYKAGTKGGEAEHTLTINEIPSHNHEAYFYGYSGWGTTEVDGYVVDWSHLKNTSGGTSSSVNTKSSAQLVQNTGSDTPHNNMPPYLVVYMWKRIS